MSIELGKINTGRNYTPYVILFIIASLVVVIFVLHTAFARATITLIPKDGVSKASLNLIVTPSADGNLTQLNAVKGRLVEKTVEQESVFREIEKKETDAFAKGTVTLYNKRAEDQSLIPSTQLMSREGVVFRTDAWILIPAKGQVEAKVTADVKGEKGNLAPSRFTIVKLWSGLQNMVYGESKETMSGGRVNDFVITNETLDQAKAKSLRDLESETLKNFEKELQPGENINPATLKSEVLEYAPKIKEGAIAREFNLKLKAKILIVVFDEELVKKIAEEKIKKQLAEAKEILNFESRQLAYKLKSADLTLNEAVIEISAEAKTRDKIPVKALEKKELSGRNIGDLQAYYKQFSEVSKIEVGFFPFWVSKVPGNEGNIEIKIKLS